MKNILLALLISAFAFPCLAQKQIQLKSPDGQIIFSFSLSKKAPVYKVQYKGVTLVDNSELSLQFAESGSFGADLEKPKARFSKVDEKYDLVVGKAKSVRNQYQEVVIPLIETKGARRKIDLVVRAFNDGLGFRYEFPEQKGWSSYMLVEENSSFNIAQNPIVKVLYRRSYNTDHEGLYSTLPYNNLKADTLMDMPALFHFPNKVYMAITEASLRDYAGMYLQKHNGVLVSRLSPLQGQSEVKVKGKLPHKTPWRVMMISDRLGALIETNILTNLNEPSKVEDVSWIKPGKTSFHWWNGDIIPDTTFAPGANFETNKYYIDFCARNNIQYHAVIGYGGFAWYLSNGSSYADPGSFSDLTKTAATLDMQKICNYAKSKGVDINVWLNWQALYPKMEEVFTQFERWGVKGMMVDFLNRDDQEMVIIQEEILKSAAKHKLYIQFHGAYKPTGMHRTYPNEFTREGTYNYEQNKWRSKPISAAHDLDIVFTRMLAGPADYHLGGFRAVPALKFKTQYTRPLMGGTRCHMLAMYVVLESYLHMVADYPSAYEGQPGFEFIKVVPTTWDETVVPDAELGEYVTIARRKGSDWYVGSINSAAARSIKVSFDFLDEGKTYNAKIYKDAPDSQENPNHLTTTVEKIEKGTSLNIELAPGGGMVMQITPGK